MMTNRREPTVSVVVAAWPKIDGLTECLGSLSGQHEHAVEVIVVSTLQKPGELEGRFPWVRWLDAEAATLVPHLWQKGMDSATGDVVAITTAHFVPADDWVLQIRRAHERIESPAIGGAIDPPRSGGTVNWATYFLRYSTYLNWHREQPVQDLPGDNASYERVLLRRHREALPDGFWEPDFHRLILKEGRTLVFAPEVRVTQRACLGFGSFCRQRFHHGRQFGRARTRQWSTGHRLLRVLASPLIPLVFLAKIGGQVLKSRRYWPAFVCSLPVLLCFLAVWALGEGWGYVSVDAHHRTKLARERT